MRGVSYEILRYPQVRKMIILEQEYLDFKNMYEGLKKCCKNVRWKTSVTGCHPLYVAVTSLGCNVVPTEIVFAPAIMGIVIPLTVSA